MIKIYTLGYNYNFILFDNKVFAVSTNDMGKAISIYENENVDALPIFGGRILGKYVISVRSVCNIGTLGALLLKGEYSNFVVGSRYVFSASISDCTALIGRYKENIPLVDSEDKEIYTADDKQFLVIKE